MKGLNTSIEHLLSTYYVPITVLGTGYSRLNDVFPLKKTGKSVDINCTKVNTLSHEHRGGAHLGNSRRVPEGGQI